MIIFCAILEQEKLSNGLPDTKLFGEDIYC